MFLPAPLTKQLHAFPGITSRFTWGDCRRHPHSLPAERPAPRPRTARSPRARGGHLPRSARARAAGAAGLRSPRLWHAFSIPRAPPSLLALHHIVSSDWGRGKQGRKTYLRATKPAHGYRLLRSGGARGPRPPAAAGAPRQLRVTPGAAPPGPVTRPPHTDRPRHGRRVKGAAPRDSRPRPARKGTRGPPGWGRQRGRARSGASAERLPAGRAYLRGAAGSAGAGLSGRRPARGTRPESSTRGSLHDLRFLGPPCGHFYSSYQAGCKR